LTEQRLKKHSDLLMLRGGKTIDRFSRCAPIKRISLDPPELLASIGVHEREYVGSVGIGKCRSKYGRDAC
jgi:hypothetical protein